jgi:ribonucleoside-diphosphate reductase alpha chain
MTDLLDRAEQHDYEGLQRTIAEAFERRTIEPKYKPNALTVFNKRYPRKDAQGEPTESPAQVHWRIALNVSSVTVLYTEGADWEDGNAEPSIVDARELDFPFRTIVRQYNWCLNHGRKLKEFSELINNGLDAWMNRAQLYYNHVLAPTTFTPNSPTWTGAGTPLGQLAACFVLPIQDSLVEGDSNIMQTLRDAVAIQKTGGGNGFSFGRLRPAGSIVGTSMGQSTGPVGFLKSYNSVFEEIRQGGSRRGANMGVVPIWHPDVISFIISKVIEGEIANFNISVAITDKFMATLKAGDDWEFHFPGPDGPIVEVEWKGAKVTSVPAKELWDFITNNAHVIGDPGALFIDTANRFNPTPRWYELESTNPCGEQWLGPYENCCLGSIALQKFVTDDGFDWEAYREMIQLSTEFLDDVVDANAYVASVPQLEEAAQGGRRIGLGLMGVADTLVLLGLRYGREDGLDFSSQATEFMRYHAMLTSANRARERGAFGRIEGSIYDADLISEHGWGSTYSGTMVNGQSQFEAVLWDAPKPLFPHTHDFGRPDVDWERVKDLILAWGQRNSCTTTYAPTGTIATTAGVEGYGCEAIFALVFRRFVMQEKQNITLNYLSGLFQQLLNDAGVDEAMQAKIAEQVAANDGSCQGIEDVPEHIRDILVVSADLTGREHVLMQGVLQAFVDNSISKTINFANDATVADVAEAYLLAWEMGCKGITIYRQGSRDLEVLSTKQASETGTVEVVDEDHWPLVTPLVIPPEAESDGLPSRTWSVRTPFGKMRSTITELASHPGRPFDVSLSVGRGGNDVNAFAEGLARIASLALRAGVSKDEIADQLIGIGGSTQEMTLRPDKALSVADAFGKLLRDYVAQANGVVMSVDSQAAGTTVVVHEKIHDPGSICPQCHKAYVVVSQGCKTCLPEIGGCGWSKC